ncbi:hypothetical protein CDEST_14406 [Colletotrichum destructivum]|uniref:Uncharacterized protein n=1 Tax=Colletotrichum destructivum TaxID=34406 RepID=A0AAX4J1G5_9PEZI|nr:hypothetical protein CDEST_14406 [Colletotrichum destructivum]
METIRILIVVGILVKSVMAHHGKPAVCAWDPAIVVEAGSILSAKIDNPWNNRCEATLQFLDPTYLPITWTFDPANCKGQQLGQFVVPKSAPSGDAVVNCHVLIRNGLGNMDSEQLLRLGRVGCISSLLQTTTILQTQTDEGNTVTRLVSSVLTLSTTSFASMPTSNNILPARDPLPTSLDPSRTTQGSQLSITSPTAPGTSIESFTSTLTAPGASIETFTSTLTSNTMTAPETGSSLDPLSPTSTTITTPTPTSNAVTTLKAGDGLDAGSPPITTPSTSTPINPEDPSLSGASASGGIKNQPSDSIPTTISVVTMTVTQPGLCTTTFTA